MNILVTGAWKCSKKQLDSLVELGHKVFYQQIESDDLTCPYTEVEGVICNGLFQYHPIDKFINLKYIQLTSAGFDRIPIDYVKQHGIEIHNARGVYSIPMAEFAVAGVLQLYKQSGFFYENRKKHLWIKNRNLIELYEKNVCIIGCGSVGTECAKRFSAFGCYVLGVDFCTLEKPWFDRIISISELDEVLTTQDIVVLTVPLTKNTKYLIDQTRIQLLKQEAILVNISRGKIIDENALITAVKKKYLSAVLDVFEDEPLDEDSLLWELDNVIISPHNSFVGNHNFERMEEVVFRNLQDWKMFKEDK